MSLTTYGLSHLTLITMGLGISLAHGGYPPEVAEAEIDVSFFDKPGRMAGEPDMKGMRMMDDMPDISIRGDSPDIEMRDK